jgi:hypothetical protein
MEKGTKNILLVNLGIFAAYTLLSFVISPKEGMVYHAFFIVIHVIISFLIGLIRLIFVKDSSDGGVYILSAALILVIGFGTCVGLMQVLGSNLRL